MRGLHPGRLVSEVRLTEMDETADETEVQMNRFDADKFFAGLEYREDIGVEELAAAIVLPVHDSWADWTFWHDYVRLTRQEFGLSIEENPEVEWLDRSIEDLRVYLAPFCEGMEAPRVVGEAFHSLNDYSEVRNAVRSLQWRFFVALILAIDPELEGRTVTLERLRERGLVGPGAVDYDDF